MATRVFGELAQRAGQPAVLGELLAGVVLGRSLLGVLDPAHPIIAALSELGVLVLLFEIGLHTDLRSLLRVGRAATMVALVGVALPFALGYAVAHLLGLPPLAAIVCGAALTATSIGISARVLSDLGQLDRPEGQVMLGAAVLDDVMGLVILSVVGALAAGDGVSVGGVAMSAGAAIGFLVVALLVGGRIGPALVRVTDRFSSAEATALIALAFALLLAWLAGLARSAPILGAFAAGLVLHQAPQREAVEHRVAELGRFFVPIFFAAVGAAVDVRSVFTVRVAALGCALTVVAVIGKFAAGYAPWWFRGDKKLIGFAMIPRGEVGLIFAQMGLATAALSESLFSAVTLVVMVTTLIGPLLLGQLARRPAAAGAQSGIDELVAGLRPPD